MNKDDRVICTLVRWLARKAAIAEWKAQGRKPEPNEIAAYFLEHREELVKEARGHPAAIQFHQQERMRLARKAVIAEIRDRGGKVNSIAPDELGKLVGAYLKEHPEESAPPYRNFVESCPLQSSETKGNPTQC